jgi:hypothetical protein
MKLFFVEFLKQFQKTVQNKNKGCEINKFTMAYLCRCCGNEEMYTLTFWRILSQQKIRYIFLSFD